jgi:hypothetical protein
LTCQNGEEKELNNNLITNLSNWPYNASLIFSSLIIFIVIILLVLQIILSAFQLLFSTYPKFFYQVGITYDTRQRAKIKGKEKRQKTTGKD